MKIRIKRWLEKDSRLYSQCVYEGQELGKNILQKQHTRKSASNWQNKKMSVQMQNVSTAAVLLSVDN